MRADVRLDPLVTPRLVLRRSVPADAEAISAYRRDPDVHRYQGWERTDLEGVRDEIERMTGRAPGEPGGWVQLTVLGPDGTLVGDVGLSTVDGEPGVVKIGYTIAPAFQRHGYATEAVSAMIEYAFSTLGAEVVRAHASAANLPSIRVAEKAGMHLVERFEHHHAGETWVGVRYEIHRPHSNVAAPERVP